MAIALRCTTPKQDFILKQEPLLCDDEHLSTTVYIDDQVIISTLDKSTYSSTPSSQLPSCTVAIASRLVRATSPRHDGSVPLLSHSPPTIAATETMSLAPPAEPLPALTADRSDGASSPTDDISTGSGGSYPTTPLEGGIFAVDAAAHLDQSSTKRISPVIMTAPLVDRMSMSCRTGSFQVTPRTALRAASSSFITTIRTATTPSSTVQVETLQAYGTDGRSFRFISRDQSSAGRGATAHSVPSALLGAMYGLEDTKAILDAAPIPMATRWRYEFAKEEDRYMSDGARVDRYARIEAWSRAIDTVSGRREEVEEPIFV